MMRDDRFRDQYLFINTAPFATLEEQDYNDIRDRYFGHMNVVFEVVERNRMDPEEINLRKSIVVKAGAKFALDDFGSGYSNHLALLALEPDIIKIDRELISGVGTDLRKQHMLEDIISYARYRGRGYWPKASKRKRNWRPYAGWALIMPRATLSVNPK